ncbi:MAG: tetratricopeptide repeat protein [Balneolaceae bacterium]|nr:tetratricopeptide repeat protein [Balneolaceae bacterium]
MKSFKTLLTPILAVLLLVGFSEITKAQDEARAEAIQLYNSAQEMAGSNEFDNAIELYREALTVSEQNDLTDIVELIEQRLPLVYASRASNAYKEYQSERTVAAVDEAISKFEESRQAAQEFGNDQVAQQASNAIPQLYYVRSILNFRQQNYEQALDDLDQAIEMNPNYAAAYYQKGVVRKNMNRSDIDSYMPLYDQAIEVAQRVNDTKTLQNARNGARDELIFQAVNLSEERQFSRATELLNRVENYDETSAEAHYRLAEIANQRGNWSNAESNAREALEYHTGGVADKAKIYFELGTALKGQGEFQNACSAFENARYGDFTEPANHQLQFELKCEGHTATGR